MRKQKVAKQNIIKHDLETVIGRIRDILRTEGITGMDSINHCIVFIICRSLNVETCKKLNIPLHFAFENIMNDEEGEEIGDNELYAKIYNRNSFQESLMDQIVCTLGFVNIKGHFKMININNVKQIFSILERLEIDLNNHIINEQCDIIGTIYEIHLKTGTSGSMRDLGQYFTNRQVIEYMVKLCEPKMKDGIIETIVDPTIGTGGFLTMAIKYLNKKYNITNWKENKARIYGFDIDENVRNMAIVNCLLETGELMKDTLIKRDTLKTDMFITSGKLEKADIILANEPMGLKNIKYADCCERIKNLEIPGTKAEPLFLQLFMETLNEGGRCSVIVPDGFLFNNAKLYKGTRKHLIENFNLKKITSLHGDFFLNTDVKTSILFFVNDGNKTEKVEFCKVELKNSNIEESSIISVGYNDIVKNGYNLFVAKYNIIKTEKQAGIKYVKINNLCDSIGGKRRTLSEATNGEFNFYTCSIAKHLKISNPDFKNPAIIMNSINGSGKCNLYVDKNYSLTSNNIHFKMKNENTNIMYVYYFLKLNISLLEKGFVGTNQKKITYDYIKNLEIPMPSLKIQNEIVEHINIISENIKTMKNNIEQCKDVIKSYVQINTMCEKEERFGNLCVAESGDYIKKDEFIEGEYPIYGGGDSKKCINKKNRNDKTVISKDGVSLNCVRYIKGDFFLNHHGWTLKYTNEHIRDKFIYYYLSSIQQKVYDLAAGSAQKGINQTSFYDLMINIPNVTK
jgi:type I restriction-modification system DNA methylase subunit